MNSEVNISGKKNINFDKIEKDEADYIVKKEFYEWMRFMFKYEKDNPLQYVTHSSIDEPKGAYYIPDEKINIFYRKYFDTLHKLENCNDEHKLHLVEMHKDVSPILIDLDIHMNLDTERQYNMEFIKKIVNLYNKIINEVLIVKNEDLVAYVFEKKNPKLNQTGSCLKDGIHIMYPNIVTKPGIQYYIRKQITEKETMILNNIFKDITFINSYSDIFDKAVIYDAGWQMYGSCKPKNYTYELKCIIDKNGNTEDNIILSLDLINLLSIRNKTTETEIINNNEKLDVFLKKEEENKNTKKKDKKKEKKHSCITEHIIFGRQGVYEDLNDYIIPCHNLLLENKEIQKCYDKWIKYGWILHNIHNVKCMKTLEIDNILLDKWIELSKKDPKFVEGDCEKRWDNMVCKDLGPGTLFMWAREYDYEKYLKITRSKLIDKQIDEICKNKKPTEKDIINFVYIIKNGHVYDHKKDFNVDEMSLLLAAQKCNLWYEYDENRHRWIKDEEDGHCLRQCLSTEIDDILWDIKLQEEYKAKDVKDNHFLKCWYESRCKILEQCREKCDTAAGNEQLMKMAKTKFTIPRDKFFKVLDENPFLINFNNGVYDLKELVFRNGRRSDLITQSCNLEYKEFSMYSEEIKTIEKFLFSILPENDVREYALTILGSCISGDVRAETFHIFTGGGGNGKSKLLDMVNAALGDFYTIMNVSALTTKRNGSAAADPELALAQGKRLVLFQEVEKDQFVNTSKLKEWTGGDEITARGLYKDPIKFKPQFKCIMTANNVPAFDSHDDGTWRRVKLVPFKTRFVNDDDYDENKSISKLNRNFIGKEDRPMEYHCKKDNKLIEQVMEYKEAFMFYLLEYYKKYYNIMKNGTNIYEPWPVIQMTEKIKAENNIYKAYFDTGLEIDIDYEGEYSDDIWAHFREYYIESGADKRRCPKKKDFLTEFLKHYEKVISYHKLNNPTTVKTVSNISNITNCILVPYLKFYTKPQKKKKPKKIDPEYYDSE